jgi:MraZ protein
MAASDTVLENEVLGQSGFVGEFTHTLDPKRRLTIPSAWRAQVGTPRSLFVLPDLYVKCLCVFPGSEMQRMMEKVRKIPYSDQKGRAFIREVGRQSDLVTWDTQGRIRIADRLLDFAGLESQVVLHGAFDNFQLWRPEHWQGPKGIDQLSLQEAARSIGF